MSDIRVRYAPSPTGLQHIGGVRTALYNYFFAKASGGKFILRIEDTDRERYSDESLQDLYDTLDFLGIKADEGPRDGGSFGPYVQSQRIELYRKKAEELVEKGQAYYCFCTSQRLDALRAEQEKNKSSQQGYDRHCSTLPLKEARERIKKGEKYVIRLRVPQEGETSFDDILLGRITRKNSDITPDPILLKSDGYPTYHLANVIDDHEMKITHIMRAQEWIPSTPLHVIMYKAFGYEIPKYCHLPMVMGSDGHKLSKRHGSTSLRDFREKGYLPEALINYVTLVGWAFDGERELFSKEELEKLFSMEKIHPSPAVFDYKKLDWFNGYYIRQKSDDELAGLTAPYFEKAGFKVTKKTLTSAMPLIKERIRVLSEAPDMLKFLFTDVLWDNKEMFLAKKQELSQAVAYLGYARDVLKSSKAAKDAEKVMYQKSIDDGVKANNVFMPLRVAITGSSVSPPLFESIEVMGISKALSRVDSAIDFLKK